MQLSYFLLLLAMSFVALEARNYLSGECNSYEREKVNEGYKPCVYKDSKDIPTIGVGFNLEKAGAISEIESVGADYNALLNGSQCLRDDQIKKLFDIDMEDAERCGSRFVNNWGELGSTRQSALADMAFSMGCENLKLFVFLRYRVEEKHYSAAAEQIRASRWCCQVKSRCDRDVSCLNTTLNS